MLRWVLFVGIGLSALAGDAARCGALHAATTRHLLLDRRNIERVENATLRVGPAVKHPANPLLAADQPWEAKDAKLDFHVEFDPSVGQFRLWYSSSQPARQAPAAPRPAMGLCYALSMDGLRWEKPALPPAAWRETPSNVVRPALQGVGLLCDPYDDSSSRRYKLLARAESGLAVSFSPDGVRWEPPRSCPEIAARGDAQNHILWLPDQLRFAAFTRMWDEATQTHVIGQTTSRDFVEWTPAVEVLRGTPERPIEALPVFRYAGVYLGLPTFFDPATGAVQTELAWSPDAVDWRRIDPGNPLLAPSTAPDAYDAGGAAAVAPLFLGDQVRLYYAAHGAPRGQNSTSTLALATLRPDRFAGYRPDDPAQPATVVARSSAAREKLYLTADLEGGSLVVAVLGREGEVLAVSETITHDLTKEPVRWRHASGLRGLQGKSVRLRFDFDHGALYAFEWAD